jgi:transketolase
MRKTFVEVASSVLEKNKQSSLFLGDIGVFGFRDALESHPNRVFNIGILEQSMISIAAGFSSEGVIPTVHTIAPFIVERAYEQIKVDFGYQSLPGNLVSVGASFDYASLGCTHHCPADVNLISNIPGSRIFIPGHPAEFANMYQTEWNNGALNYFRLSESTNREPIQVKFGKSRKIQDGKKAIVIAVGPILDEILDFAPQLDIEIHYLNSFDSNNETEFEISNSSKTVILVEPYYSGLLLQSTMGSLASQGFSIHQIGVPKKFIRKYGSYHEQLNYLRMSSEHLMIRIAELIK